MMSASMSDVGRYVVLMAFLSQASRTKWKRTRMCVVRSWNFGFFASWIAPWLSTTICWGAVALPYNMRAYKERTQMASFTASDAPMYSASTV